MGNSLGGLYARHCLADLASGTTVATLQPRTFLTIATPHLGIRRHTFVPMPQSLVDWGAGIFAGLSGSDLALRNDLVYNMAVDDAYTRPLSLFAARRAYANVAGDFLVPLATAAFIPTAEARPELAPAPAGAPDGVGRIAGQLTTASATCAGPAAAPRDSAGDSTAMEVAMASSLDALGWTKVFVEFPGQIVPLSHSECFQPAPVASSPRPALPPLPRQDLRASARPAQIPLHRAWKAGDRGYGRQSCAEPGAGSG